MLYLTDSTENSEEIDDINFICSRVLNSLMEGGSVLILLVDWTCFNLVGTNIAVIKASNLKSKHFRI